MTPLKIILLIALLLTILFLGCFDTNTGTDQTTTKVSENTLELCSDTLDNDLDTFYDCLDQDCKIFAICASTSSNSIIGTESSYATPTVSSSSIQGTPSSSSLNAISSSSENAITTSTIKSNLIYTYTTEDTLSSVYIQTMWKENTAGIRRKNYISIIIKNNNPMLIELKAEAEISGLTEVKKDRIFLQPNQKDTIELFPRLMQEKFATLNEATTASYKIKLDAIYNNETINLIDATPSAIITAKDVIYWKDYNDNTEKLEDWSFLIAGWVTPRVGAIDTLIRYAANELPSNQFVGYQGTEGYVINAVELDKLPLYRVDGTKWDDLFGGPDLILAILDKNKNVIVTTTVLAQNLDSNSLSKKLLNISIPYIEGFYVALYDSDALNTSEQMAISNYITLKVGEKNYLFGNGNNLAGTLEIYRDEQIVTSQVKAIYNALKKEYHITYVNSPLSFPKGTQRVKYPADALRLASANCIEGAVLFAAALENVNLNPIIVIIPGHAFVGWETWNGSNIWRTLETVMIGSSDFEVAKEEGRIKLNNEIENENFTNKVSQIWPIKNLREIDLKPLF